MFIKISEFELDLLQVLMIIEVFLMLYSAKKFIKKLKS